MTCKLGVLMRSRPNSAGGLVPEEDPQPSRAMPELVAADSPKYGDFQVKVGATGFEPATFRPPAECATRLRHAPSWVDLSLDRPILTAFPRRECPRQSRGSGLSLPGARRAPWIEQPLAGESRASVAPGTASGLPPTSGAQSVRGTAVDPLRHLSRWRWLSRRRSSTGRLRHTVHMRATEDLRGTGREPCVSTPHEASVS